MAYKHKLTNIIVISLFAVLVGLTGCDLSSETPTEATSTQAIGATATPESAGSVASPTEPSDAVEESTEVAVSPTAAEEDTTESTATMGSAAQEVSCAKLNLNTLTEDQLMSTIPNFSSRMVREFFEYRPYVSIQQFRREIGKYVDDVQVAEYEKYVYVPVDPNESDAETLMQLPDVDSTIAEQLAAGRPYASGDAFLQALATHVNEQQLSSAKCYLVASP